MKKRANESWDEFRKKFVIAKLRNASLQWPARNEAKNSARKERGLYECYLCKNLFRNGQFQMDHIVPVVQVTKGYSTIEEYAVRLLSEPSNWGVACTSCHDAKTQAENHTRDAIRQQKQELDKKIKKEAKKLAKKK